MEDEIYITGMAGRFPNADNVAEYWEKLCNKVDCVSEEGSRWTPGVFGIPKRMGLLKELDKFDNLYFGINHKSANELDPQGRILLEVAYESIVDAGYDPETLRGKNIGVYIGNGASGMDSIVNANEDGERSDGYYLLGYTQSLFANRISYSFDFKGPSMVLDTACSSGATALYLAVQDIRSGNCDAAIVGASVIHLHPDAIVAFKKMKFLSDEGKCKSLDANRNGFTKSEAIVSLFIQKKSDARRTYASVAHIKTNIDGYKTEGITFPSSKMQACLMRDTLKEANLDPSDISYLEAHAAGTQAGDPVEMAAIRDVYCCGRKEPLLLGAVKSNIGHTEVSSGLCCIMKIVLAMETGVIPPNLHFNEPLEELAPLMDKEVKVITELMPWTGTYAVMNSFGFGGVNVNAVIKRPSHPPRKEDEKNEIVPQLLLYCGRTEESVQSVFENSSVTEAEREFYALLHKLAYASTKKKPYRGYKILSSKENIEDIKLAPYEKRPVWYVFSGMGSQWPGMAKDLMQFEIFRKSIRKSENILKKYVPDFMDLLTNEYLTDNSINHDANSQRKIIPAFVSIAAIQVALVDILNELGIEPDGIVGHSVGELGCAYADGGFSAEQMLLAAYWRGKATEDSDLIQGSMAATGMTWSEALERCPEGIYPACHNAEESVTISGPSDSMQAFISKLKDENVFVREVNACGYAYHCKYVLPIAENLQKPMEKLIPVPKERSSRWISSSFPKDEWETEDARSASASYFVHNLISPVLFRDALSHIPKDAIVIEIGPHQLLQPILKREIGTEAIHIGLMKRNADNIIHFLSSIGNMYTAGLNPNIEKLYAPVAFPVPRNTPRISPLIKWDHSETWVYFKWGEESVSSIMNHRIEPDSIHDRYLFGHCIDGRTLFPASGYIVLVWKTFAKMQLVESMNLTPIAFHNLKFMKPTLLSAKGKRKLTVVLTSKSSGYFEISEKGEVVCTGFVSNPTEEDNQLISKDITIDKESLILKERDIYKEFSLRGYEYGKTFQGIKASNLSGSEGTLNWNENWIVFLDTLFQFSLLCHNKRLLLLPTGIEKLVINPSEVRKFVEEQSKEEQSKEEQSKEEQSKEEQSKEQQSKEQQWKEQQWKELQSKEQQSKYNEGIPMKFYTKTRECFSPGIYAENVNASFTKRRPEKQKCVLQEHKFIPYEETCCLLDDKKKLLQDYSSLCVSLSQKALYRTGKMGKDVQNMENIDDDHINKYLQSDVNDYVLMKYLLNILENEDSTGSDIDQYSKEIVKKYINEFGSDVLHKVLLEESILNTAFEVVFENNVSNTLKIFEITEGCNTISSKLNEYNPVPALLKPSYSILHTNEDLLNKDLLPSNAKVIPFEYSSPFEFQDADLFILYYLNMSLEQFGTTLEKAVGCLKEQGFILLIAKTGFTESEMNLSKFSELSISCIPEYKFESLFKDMKLNVICKKNDSFTSTLYLLRKCATESYNDSFIYINVSEYPKWIDRLKEKIIQIQNSPSPSVSERLWLVSEDSPRSGIIGLANCVRQEPGGTNVRCIFIQNKTPRTPDFSLTSPFYKKQIEKNLVMNVLQNDTWGSYRHIRCKTDNCEDETEHAYLNIRTIGDLSTLEWVNSSTNYSTSMNNGALCHVYYSSLNFKDVMIATGRVPLGVFSGGVKFKDSILGFEFSGRMSDGRRVMGIVSHKGMATSVVTHPLLVWDVPHEWSLEEAATVPVVYATAYYALIFRGKLKHGERILIHSGSGGVGQAAISIALSMGCDVYTTVGSDEKKEFLMKKFPELREDHIGNSRNTSFKKDILNSTDGKGVHVVLNSLAEEKFYASLSCVAYNGRFLEIGAYDIANNSNLGMALFGKNISFHGIILDTLFHTSEYDTDNIEILQLIKNGISDGVVKPLNTTVFNYDEAEKAFRYMASGKHIGKVLLKIREEEKTLKALPSPIRISALRQTLFDPRKSYIIIGGLGGMGLEVTEWLIQRGAKYIVLSSRSGITSGYQKRCLQRWEEESVQVLTTKLNAAKHEEASKLITLAAELGPVGGIFNLALVLKDGLLESQTVQNLLDVCEAKVESTMNMDLLSRKFCTELDWFVCFSSLVAGRGNVGQTNYGYANSVMERICEERMKQGLPGLAIQWGAIADVGVVSETLGSDIVIGGTVPQRIRSCLTVLDKFLQLGHPVVSSFAPYEPTDAKTILKEDLMSYVSKIFGINDISSINPETNLTELGMDSLMAVELRQVLETNFDIYLNFNELRNLKVKDLKNFADQSSSKKNEKEVTAVQNVNEDLFQKLDDLLSKDFISSETIVLMNAITEGVPLFLIHPIEGNVSALETLASLLPCPVYGIQATISSPRDTVENLASWYWKHIKELNISIKHINLAGYSYGAMVAFEMALQAEQDPTHYPELQHVIFLEGSHNFLTSTLHSFISRIDEGASDETRQIASIQLFISRFRGNINLEPTDEILKLQSLPEQIQYIVDKVSVLVPKLDSDVIEAAYSMFSSAIQICLSYDPKIKLKKDVHLIKASKSLAVVSHLSELYDLEKVCEGKITCNVIEGTHQSIIQGSSAQDVANLMKEMFNS